jgi:hypothetical protein
MATLQEEKRSASRMPADYFLEVKTENRLKHGATTNVSLEGMGLYLPIKLEVGQHVQARVICEFCLQHQTKWRKFDVDLNLEVRWLKNVYKGFYHYGMKLTSLEKAIEAGWKKCLPGEN